MSLETGAKRPVARPPFLGFVFCLGKRDSSRWESGNPAFGFLLFHGPRRRGGGNVEITPLAISKGRWARRPLVFLRVHGPVISTALFALSRFQVTSSRLAQGKIRFPKGKKP